MRRTAALILVVFALGGCASIERPAPLTQQDVIRLSKEGRDATAIIEELKRTDTVIPLAASELIRLHEAGVPAEVLDHLQRVQIDEIRWREQMFWFGPGTPGLYPCPWPYLRGFGPFWRGGPWGC
jgi:hypothetical protein